MTLSELIESLVNLAATGNGDAEIRLAHQPHYPHQYKLHGIKLVNLHEEEIMEIRDFLHHADPDADADAIVEAQEQLEKLQKKNTHVVYFTEGSHVGYASKDLWDEDD